MCVRIRQHSARIRLRQKQLHRKISRLFPPFAPHPPLLPQSTTGKDIHPLTPQ
ncbi:hypothetical protein COO91_05253 [Nostoc flagelliforme CCNUN1]|uniref:Uncharacterized protein n=1 Tax=Nostoc flagelliforme CCNUN1 TaxID=2038116 RepID=A0A2K8SUX2_9NOSO|nr:hypothetical protein COO91_05253 [Nostoc flagelliforme CCNUN1]